MRPRGAAPDDGPPVLWASAASAAWDARRPASDAFKPKISPELRSSGTGTPSGICPPAQDLDGPRGVNGRSSSRRRSSLSALALLLPIGNATAGEPTAVVGVAGNQSNGLSARIGRTGR